MTARKGARDLTGERWWAPARERERAALVRRAMADERVDFTLSLQWLNSPDWVTVRRAPCLPTMWKIASYWAERADWFEVIIDRPHCFACGLHGGWPDDVTRPRDRWDLSDQLERGHLVNRARDGLDGAQNLVPLCHLCNKVMPIFDVEHGGDATAWVILGGCMAEWDIRLQEAGVDWRDRMHAQIDVMEERGGCVSRSERSAEESHAAVDRIWLGSARVRGLLAS